MTGVLCQDLLSAIKRCEGLNNRDRLVKIGHDMKYPRGLDNNIVSATHDLVKWCLDKANRIDELVKTHLFGVEFEGDGFSNAYWDVLAFWLECSEDEKDLEGKREFIKKEIQPRLVDDQRNKIQSLLNTDIRKEEQQEESRLKSLQNNSTSVSSLSLFYEEENGVVNTTMPYAFYYDGFRYEPLVVKSTSVEKKPNFEDDKVRVKNFISKPLETVDVNPERIEFISDLENLLRLEFENIDEVVPFRKELKLTHYFQFVCRTLASLSLNPFEIDMVQQRFKHHQSDPNVFWRDYNVVDQQISDGCNAFGCCNGTDILSSDQFENFRDDVVTHAVALISRRVLSEDEQGLIKKIQFGPNLPESVKSFRKNHEAMPIILFWSDPDTREELRKRYRQAHQLNISSQNLTN